MISLINRYRKEENLNLLSLVNSLEGSLSAVEEKLPQSFYDNWYKCWGGLEMYLAMGLENDRKREILENLARLERLVIDQIKE